MKVKNHVVRKKGKFHLVDDGKVLESIAEFLRRAKLNLKTTQQDEEKSINKKITLMDSLLTKKGNKYEKIAIVRLADQTGPIEGITTLQEEKEMIKTMLSENIQYANVASNDYDFTISEDSKARVHELIIEMNQRLIKLVSRIGSEIKEFYRRNGKQRLDIIYLHKKLNAGHQRSKISNTF